MTFERLDTATSFFVWRYVVRISMSLTRFKVIGQGQVQGSKNGRAQVCAPLGHSLIYYVNKTNNLIRTLAIAAQLLKSDKPVAENTEKRVCYFLKKVVQIINFIPFYCSFYKRKSIPQYISYRTLS